MHGLSEMNRSVGNQYYSKDFQLKLSRLYWIDLLPEPKKRIIPTRYLWPEVDLKKGVDGKVIVFQGYYYFPT